MPPIDFCHIPVSIIKRSEGRSAVAAAAYRSGTKLTNEWDGLTHDYTRKGGVVHAEIMLPAHAPPEFADRSTLWNSVEQIEKARDSQLAREIEAALPRELSGEQQLALVRAYVKDNFVDKGMCADFAIHDKGTGNPHVHIMLTLRPLKENGQWGAKCRKAYDLDENGQRIPDGKGGWKNHREDTTDWNDKGNVEIWRAAWAAYTNRALESAGILVFYQKSPVYNPQFTYGKPYARVHSRSGTSSNYGKFERQGSESNDGRRYPGNVLFVPTVSGGIHPTQKPVELCEYLIRTYTHPGELVADICVGSGTTAIAAINTERRFVCFETAPSFYAAASERIRAAQAVKSSGEKGV